MNGEDKIPKDLLAGLEDPNNFNKICEIAEKFRIAGKYSEGINKLDTIFEKVLSGGLSFGRLAETIKKEFGFSDELSNDIAKEMNSQIFSRYKSSLEKLYSEKAAPQQKEENLSYEKEKVSEEFPEKNVLEEEILKEIQKPEKEKIPEEKTNQEKEEEIDNVLYKLEEELRKEKEKMKELDRALKKETPK